MFSRGYLVFSFVIINEATIFSSLEGREEQIHNTWASFKILNAKRLFTFIFVVVVVAL